MYYLKFEEMKKCYRLAILSLVAVFSATLFNSCEEDLVRSGYSYGIDFYEGTTISFEGEPDPVSPLKVISDYLEEVDCFVTDEYTFVYFESETKAENVEKAITFFDRNIEKIDEVEFAEKMKGLDAKFTYLLIGEAPDSKEAKILASKEYKFGSYATEE